MTKLDDILNWASELLEPGRFRDHCPNGLQVPGTADVEHVVTGVSATLELLEAARDRGAQLVLAHHGVFWDGQPLALSRPLAARLRTLLEADMSLAAYHLPLDAHPEIGNNAQLADLLGCEARTPFAEHGGIPIGMAGRFPGDGVPIAELVERVRAVTAREPLVFDAGPERVSSLGIVSGGAAGDLWAAVDAGLDAFLTGEPSEHVMGTAREAGVHFIAAGHYATETFGIRRLGELAAERFGLRHEFVDLPNPI